MALTADEQRLVNWAKAQLPEWFSHGEREEEYLGALAKMHGQSLSLAQNWLGQTLILTAVGATGGDADWLDMHAGERDTKRQAAETDPTLRQRIRAVEDAVTRPVLLAAAQAIVDAEGIVGTVQIVELRRDGAYYGTYQSDTGTGGTFVDQGAGIFSFTPTVPFRHPVLNYPQSTHWQNPEIEITTATAPANNGNFPVLSLDGDAVTYANGSGVAGVDGAATWAVNKRDVEGNVRANVGRAYYNRGYRMRQHNKRAFVIILPFGCTAATSIAIVEMLRQKKGDGVLSLVECRTSP